MFNNNLIQVLNLSPNPIYLKYNEYLIKHIDELIKVVTDQNNKKTSY